MSPTTLLPWITLPLQAHYYILHSTSLLWFTLFTLITILFVTSHRKTYSIHASSYCILLHCPWSTPSYKYMTILYFTSLPWVTLLRRLHTALYVTVLGRTTTSKSPYSTLSPVSHLHVTWDHGWLPNEFQRNYTSFKVSLAGNLGQGGREAALPASHRHALTQPLPALAGDDTVWETFSFLGQCGPNLPCMSLTIALRPPDG